MTKSTFFILFSFIVATVASMGSLFFSEVMNFIPCNMCWYQRIFMYPLVFIFLMNLLFPDEKVFKYAMPIVVIGLSLSIYHNLLMFGIIPESALPCVQGVPCSTKYINWFGFINIPLLSFLAYFMIFLSLLFFNREIKSKNKIFG